MKILLDENLPRKLVAALRAEGHAAESVQKRGQTKQLIVFPLVAKAVRHG